MTSRRYDVTAQPGQFTNDDRRLIEDLLPIEATGKEALREKSIRKRHISTLHLCWTNRPPTGCCMELVCPSAAALSGRGGCHG
ncbi:MAG: DUF1156 domain-containing protein [Halothiobacillaceae bacterium]